MFLQLLCVLPSFHELSKHLNTSKRTKVFSYFTFKNIPFFFYKGSTYALEKNAMVKKV